ncbi:MAG: hypothetical protein SGI77_02125 [Pirellulaceae bacterium]|nr:hypothetical protein [Pirellulaceae bacterium]
MMNELVTTQRPGSVAVALFLSTKVQSQHLEKLALVYVRQSSQRQVENNVESTDLQYRLSDRVEAYGWPKSRIEIIDNDLD